MMEPLQLTTVSLSRNIDLRHEALPDAPTVAYEATPQRAREFVADALHRLGDAVAPRTANPATR